MTDRLSNADARRLFLWLHGLSNLGGAPLRRADVAALVERIGFVQIDSTRTVERAHHHILFSRAGAYKPAWLDHHVERERTLFENWTHDASIIPAKFFPYWKPRFEKARGQIMSRQWWRERVGEDPEKTCARVLDYVAENGPVMARELKAENPEPPPDMDPTNTAWWGWHPSKAALVFLWRTGQLSVTRREGFQKVYDLTERVVPAEYREHEPTEAEFLDWTCGQALDRVGFASHSEIARYWEAINPATAKTWCEGAGRNRMRAIEVEGIGGEIRDMYVRPDIEELLAAAPEAPPRVRFLSPFDPIVRDRKRAEWLFGFDFRIEIYVPAAQRKYGYYVYPMLERDRLIGRIEIKADRDAGTLDVIGLWLEPKIRMSKPRQSRIDAELERWRRYLGLDRVVWRESVSVL
jgi:uncharacterized protein YcaQ